MPILNVYSMFDTSQKEENEKLYQFVERISFGESPSIDTTHNDFYDYDSLVYSVKFSSGQDLKDALNLLNNHRYLPLKDFEEIYPNTFTFTIESDIIDPLETHLNLLNQKYLEEQINMIDYICSDIVNEQEDLSQKVDALYGFIEKSGVVQYKQMIQAFISVLEEKQVISNKEEIFKRIFKEIH